MDVRLRLGIGAMASNSYVLLKLAIYFFNHFTDITRVANILLNLNHYESLDPSQLFSPSLL